MANKKYMIIDNETSVQTTFTIIFEKMVDNPAFLYDDRAEEFITRTMTETHSFDSNMMYRMQRFLKYEYENTHEIVLTYDTLDFGHYKHIVKDVVPDDYPVGIYLEGRSVYILKERTARAMDIPVFPFKTAMERLEKDWIHSKIMA